MKTFRIILLSPDPTRVSPGAKQRSQNRENGLSRRDETASPADNDFAFPSRASKSSLIRGLGSFQTRRFGVHRFAFCPECAMLTSQFALGHRKVGFTPYLRGRRSQRTPEVSKILSGPPKQVPPHRGRKQQKKFLRKPQLFRKNDHDITQSIEDRNRVVVDGRPGRGVFAGGPA